MASEIRTNSITSRTGLSTISLTSTGPIFAGIATFTGSIGIAGTLTYEDVTNIDSIGIITARSTVSIADSIVHTGDTNTAIRFPAADTVSVETAGSQRLRITSAGNVNIGGNYDETSHPLNVSDSTKPSLALHTGTTIRADFSANTGITSIRSFSNSPFTINIGGSGETEAFRINGSGKIIVGNNGTNFGNAAVQSFIQHGNTAGESAFSAVDTTSVAAGVGGEITFHGKYNTGAQDYAYFGHIRGRKENANNGDTACALSFHTRPNATAPQERVRITSDGHTLFSGLTTKNDPRNAKGITVKSTDGVSFQNFGANGSRNWRIRPDDQSRWGDLDFSVSPTANSATDWPDAAADRVLVLGYDGTVTKPNNAMFAAHGSGDAIVAQSPLVFDSLVYDIGSHWNNSTYKFLCPVSGYYYVTCHVVPTNFATNNQNVELYIKNNGGTRYFLDRKVKTGNYSTNNFSVGGSRIVYAAANDNLWVEFNSISGSPTLEGSSHLGVMLMA